MRKMCYDRWFSASFPNSLSVVTRGQKLNNCEAQGIQRQLRRSGLSETKNKIEIYQWSET